jgi:hypothetical protein
MKNLFRLELVLLSLGWISSIFFMLYAQGMFDPKHDWSGLDLLGMGILTLELSVPYLVTAWLYRKFERFALLLLIGSLIMIGWAIYGYYSTYFAHPIPDGAGWVFMIVPFFQMIFVALLFCMVFIAGKIGSKKRSNPATAE